MTFRRAEINLNTDMDVLQERVFFFILLELFHI